MTITGMKKATKLAAVALMATTVLTGLGMNATQASAKTGTHVRYYKNIKNRAMWVKNKKATVYTAGSLKKHEGTLSNFGSKVEVYYEVHVTKANGHRAVYYKFRTSNHKTGWVWHGYLSNVKVKPATQKVTNKNKPKQETVKNDSNNESGSNGFGNGPAEEINWKDSGFPAPDMNPIGDNV